MSEFKLINDALKSHYGCNDAKEPIFRLVWSEDLLEKRHGTFRKYHGPIFLGETIGIETCKKYSYIKDKWVLEVYTPSAKGNPEIDSDGYEPVWVFNNLEGKYPLPPLEVVEFIVSTWDFSKGVHNRKNDSILKSEDDEKFAQEVKSTEQALEENSSSPLMSQFHDKTAVIVHKKEIN